MIGMRLHLMALERHCLWHIATTTNGTKWKHINPNGRDFSVAVLAAIHHKSCALLGLVEAAGNICLNSGNIYKPGSVCPLHGWMGPTSATHPVHPIYHAFDSGIYLTAYWQKRIWTMWHAQRLLSNVCRSLQVARNGTLAEAVASATCCMGGSEADTCQCMGHKQILKAFY